MAQISYQGMTREQREQIKAGARSARAQISKLTRKIDHNDRFDGSLVEYEALIKARSAWQRYLWDLVFYSRECKIQNHGVNYKIPGYCPLIGISARYTQIVPLPV